MTSPLDSSTAAANEVLRRVFKLTEFRPLQKEVIDEVLAHHSALVIMPTGAGKSLTYQLPSLLLKNLTLVISPLKALMKDQVDKLRALGVRAQFINSDVDRTQREKRLKDLAEGRYQIFYVTPERFRKPEFVESLKKQKVSLLVVDEAHCISQWGHDFRPDYAKVGELRKLIDEHLPTLALTATATPEVQKEICEKLEIAENKKFILPITRPHLEIEVADVYGEETKFKKLCETVEQTRGTKIAYFSLIKTLHGFSTLLNKKKIDHVIYHGEMPAGKKADAQNRFLSGESDLILATPAFGLGIDKPDVRAVMHLELPGSVEAYFQEIGRAGRDEKPAKCLLLYDQEDVSIQMEFIEWSNPEPDYIRQIAKLIAANFKQYRQEGADFLREKMSFHNRRDYRVETAIGLLDSWGLIDEEVDLAGLEKFMDSNWRTVRKKHQQEKLLKLVNFVNTEDCRQEYIYGYFGEKNLKRCGVCDNCHRLREKK
jgi:ATP-dependent DNA helicase RecQ